MTTFLNTVNVIIFTGGINNSRKIETNVVEINLDPYCLDTSHVPNPKKNLKGQQKKFQKANTDGRPTKGFLVGL